MHSIVIGGSLFDPGFIASALYGRAAPISETQDTSDLSCCEARIASLSKAPPAPLFCPTSQVFRFDRDLLECHATKVEAGGGGGALVATASNDTSASGVAVAKVSTAGLCVVWAQLPPGTPRELSACSISQKVEGFYDVLVGHTGERHGVAAKARGEEASERRVSPLSKVRMAEDFASTLVALLGSEDAAASWLRSGDTSGLTGTAAPAVEEKEVEVGSPSPSKRLRSCASEAVAAEPDPAGVATYAWFKGRASSAAHLARRHLFHASGPFSHWRRKSCHEDDAVVAADAFPLIVPVILKAVCPRVSSVLAADAGLP